ncbi:MAG: hypothetical protein QY304_02225 [Candidatus Paceibacterota bacterium]|nr:MAG: hypothetical protein QY304_02225 [Candidatus Paceibacterota bacterium]
MKGLFATKKEVMMATIRWDKVREMRNLIKTEAGQVALTESHLGGVDVESEEKEEWPHLALYCSTHKTLLQVDPYTGEQVCTECSPRYWA